MITKLNNPTQLKHVAILSCDLSLITMHASDALVFRY